MPDYNMTFSGHLSELRKTLITCVVILFGFFVLVMAFREEVFEFTLLPYKMSMKLLEENKFEASNGKPEFIAHGYHLPIIAFLKVSFYLSLFVSLPLILIRMWMFVEKGLYPGEKKKIVLFGLLSLLLFEAGIVLGYLLFLPYVLYFLVIYSFPGTIRMVYSFAEYLNILVLMTVAVGFIFQIPVIMGFLSNIGVVNWKTLVKFWKYFLVLSVLIAALLTPPDVVSQLMLAIPMCLLYIVGIFLAYLLGRRQTRSDNT